MVVTDKTEPAAREVVTAVRLRCFLPKTMGFPSPTFLVVGVALRVKADGEAQVGQAAQGLVDLRVHIRTDGTDVMGH
ncbi:MAG: hypothetical protein OXN89_01330 [Bryobacterales bacterium]|nr:hypothetical protein [Bryobacterales bacterium]